MLKFDAYLDVSKPRCSSGQVHIMRCLCTRWLITKICNVCYNDYQTNKRHLTGRPHRRQVGHHAGRAATGAVRPGAAGQRRQARRGRRAALQLPGQWN